jgi:NTE family protein
VVYQALYERITKNDRESGIIVGSVLDIVAETSIVAINAAIIVSYVVENNSGRAPQKD